MAVARFNDGRTAAAHPVTLNVDDGVLRFDAPGRVHGWPLHAISEERLGGLVRLSCPIDADARLTLDAQAWRGLRGPNASTADRRRRTAERRLVGGLAAIGGVVLLLVLVVLPAASGPLARATPIAWETGLGDSIEAQIVTAFRACSDLDGQAILYRFGDRFEPHLSRKANIRVRAIEAPFANAFALPGGAILVTDDLIREARSPDELSAVIAHEAAHIEQGHVMAAVWRSFGLGLVLDALVGGGTGAGQQAVLLAGSATNLRFSRTAEAEADARGIELLQALGLSSQGMGSFFARMAAESDDGAIAAAEEFMSSHPGAARRARAARASGRVGEPAFKPAEWAAVKDACGAKADTRWRPPFPRRP